MPEYHGKTLGTAVTDPAKVKQAIVEWLQETGNYTTVEGVPATRFAILGKYPNQVPGGVPLNFYVLQPNATKFEVDIVANITINDQNREVLRSMNIKDREALYDELRFGLVFQCGYALQNDDKTGELLSIQLSETVYLDSNFSKRILFTSIQQVWRSYIFIVMKLRSILPTVSLV